MLRADPPSRRSRGPRSLLAIVLLCCASATAQAQDARTANEPDERRLRLAALLGYSPQDDSDAGSRGLALGLKASYALLGWVHLGLEGTFHSGTQFGDELNRTNYYALEVGGRISQQWLGITPYLTGGIASVSSQRNIDPSFLTGCFGLGISLDGTVLEWLVLGIDVRAVMVGGASRQLDNGGPSVVPDLMLMAGVRL